MIKRYGMGVQSIPLGDGVSLNVPDITEKQDGDYVRYEDHIAEISKMVEQMEAIGAGGVSSERITQQGKAIEQRRAEFEEWISEDLNVQPDEEVNYSNEYVRSTMKGWMAARGIKE